MSYAVNISHAYNGENARRAKKNLQARWDSWPTEAALLRIDHERPSVLARRRKLNQYWNRSTRNVIDRKRLSVDE